MRSHTSSTSVRMGLFGRLGKVDRSSASAKSGDEDGEEEKQQAAAAGGGAFAADPRGLSAERPLGASERPGHHNGASGGRTGGLGGVDAGGGAAASQEQPSRRKKTRATGEHAEPSAGGGGATGSAATATGQTAGGGGMPVASSVNDFISKTKSQKRKGLKPSGPELIAYARYLGIDPVADHDLLWIAVEALEAPLPSTWSEHFDSNDRVFYYNASTRVSSWTHPLEHVYRETYTTIVTFRNSNLSPAERGEQLRRLQAECEQMERDVHREISLWTEHHDEQGHRFYFNAQEKQSTWTDPRPAQCHILYLKMKLVRVLSSCSGVASAAGAAAAAAASGGGQVGEGGAASRFAPSLSGTSPRREREGGGAVASDLGGKWAKVGSGGEAVDQFPRRGSGDLGVGGGSARGTGSESDAMDIGGPRPNTLDNEGWADSETEAERHRRRKKEKKKKKRDLSGDDRGGRDRDDASGGRQNLNHSQSEPTVMGKREAAPPPESHEARGLGGGPYPAVPHNFPEGESLSQVGRSRVKAGIRLQPLQPIGGGGTSVAGGLGQEASGASAGMHMSSSVPELKPLEKLQPL